MQYSIIQKSQLEGALRLDAEFYQPEYLDVQEKIKQLGSLKLGEIVTTLTDYHANGSYEVLRNNVQLLLEKDYALMVRAIDLQEDNYENDVRYVSEHAYNFLKKTKVSGGDLIINKIGNAGEVYFMPAMNRPVTLGMNLFLLRLKTDFEPAYVYAFLTSKYGKMLIYRRVTGTVPTSIDKDSIRSISVPVFSSEVQKSIKAMVDRSYEEKNKSASLYKEAEGMLLEELGLKDFESAEDLYSIVNFSEIQTANRMDAEYFQPKYEKLISKIKSQNSKLLGELVSMKKGVEPGSEAYGEEGKLFIRVSNITKQGLVDGNQKYISEELCENLQKDYQPKEGEILLTKDATPGIAYVLKENIEGVISGGILRLKLKEDIELEYLALCINSAVGQMQAERDAGGSIIMHWKPEEIKKVLIPILPKEMQEKIAELVRESHEARKKAKQILEEAKHKVEYMIENQSNGNSK